MSITDVERLGAYAWGHKHMVYSYFLLRLAMISRSGKVNAFFHRLRGVSIGEGVEIEYDVLLDPVEPGSITIEDQVRIGPHVTIFAHTNPTLPLYEYMGPRTVSEVRIKEGAQIGAGAIILPGVTIGRRCIIEAGAVVTKDIPDFATASGVPAQLVNVARAPVKSENAADCILEE